jgi:hypothetical protein
MKTILIALLLATTQAHASTARGEAGHHGASLGSTARATSSVSSQSAAAAPAQGSNGRYSLVDGYQPWQQAEMQQFAKPKFVPFDGK